METSIRLAVLLVLAGVGTAPQEKPAESKHPIPVAVSVLEVRADSAVAIDTRRQSFYFEFHVLRTIEDGARVATEGDLMQAGRIGFRCFQGSDKQSNGDAATRLVELLDAKRGGRDPANSGRSPYALGDVGVLRLTILRREPPTGDLWILKRADGRRETIGYEG